MFSRHQTLKRSMTTRDWALQSWVAAGKKFTSTKSKKVGRLASLLTCFGVGTTISGQEESIASQSLKIYQGTNVCTEEPIPERCFISELLDKIFAEMKEVPWAALEAKILLYRSVIHQEPSTTVSFKNFGAYSAYGDRRQQLNCVYVTPLSYFLKKASSMDRGEFLEVPQLSESMQTILMSSMSDRGYRASFDVCKLKKGLRDAIDVPCLLVKW